MKYIEVRNLNCNDRKVSFCLDEKWNSFYGRQRNLIPILMGKMKYDGYININGNFLCENSINDLKNKLYCVSKNDHCFGNNLYEELLMTGNQELVDDYIINYGLVNYKYLEFKNIPFDKKIIVSILFGILKGYKFIFLDNVLCFLSKNDRDNIYSLLMKNNIIVLNFTTNPEELLYSSKIIKLSDFTISSINEIKDIKIIDLCNRLIDYGLIDKCYSSIEEVVSNL